ncbi:MAG: CRTAC1 family protein [Saprospiraceae bacterium]|nr:CRTAC1 family protein [Saprospiraceae bacterium]
MVQKQLLIFVSACFITSGSCKLEDKKKEDSKSIEQYISEVRNQFNHKSNTYALDAIIAHCDAQLLTNLNMQDRLQMELNRADALLKKGLNNLAIESLNFIIQQIKDPYKPEYQVIGQMYALAHLRLAEQQNCLNNHSNESCILPIMGEGIHKDQSANKIAIESFLKLLEQNPTDYASRWLLNIAYMTIGEYPDNVPKKWLVPGLDQNLSKTPLKAFENVAPELGLNRRNMAGGVIIEDFNNDKLLDIVLSDWGLDSKLEYFINDGVGGFTKVSESSGLSKITGGLNMLCADYDNDGDSDILVLRGGWYEKLGKIPNSLVRNNGDNTFTDVTVESGILSFHPTQTGVFQDFNNDGFLDLFIGNESSQMDDPQPCELFINKGDGTFTEVAKKAGCDIVHFIKGTTAGDYNNDGLMDIFLSSAYGERFLLKNTGIQDGIPQFTNVAKEAGLLDIVIRCFPTWFWDFNNDGWLDIFISGYEPGINIAHAACTEALQIPNEASHLYLYKNNGDGTFTNISKKADLHKTVLTMGANFGDIDNDGHLDMYLTTGNPGLTSLTPNKLFRNKGDETFEDVTYATRLGNLQKGHGVSIADIDNDGDQDIFHEIGGAYPGDAYFSALYTNPGQNKNNWIKIQLTGKETNASAVGSRIKLTFKDRGKQRSVYRDVNTGGSFGCSPIRREIGIGQAKMIDEIEITWQKTQKTLKLKDIQPNQFISITEGEEGYKVLDLKTLTLKGDSTKLLICNPVVIP